MDTSTLRDALAQEIRRLDHIITNNESMRTSTEGHTAAWFAGKIDGFVICRQHLTQILEETDGNDAA